MPVWAVHPVLWARLTRVALAPHQSGVLLQKIDTITEIYNCSKCRDEATTWCPLGSGEILEEAVERFQELEDPDVCYRIITVFYVCQASYTYELLAVWLPEQGQHNDNTS